MGEYAELIIDGTLCQQCMCPVLDPATDHGVPRTCADCRAQLQEHRFRRAAVRDRAIDGLKKACVAFTIHNNGWHLVIREPGRVRVDFYPSKSFFIVAGGERIKGGWSSVVGFVRGKRSMEGART